MRTVIVTQEEPFYLPIFVSKVLGDLREVAAIIILPGIPTGFTPLSYIKRLHEIFGMKDFLIYGALFVYYRILDSLTYRRYSKRSYSVHSIARMNSIPVYKWQNINSSKSLDLLKVLQPEVIISVASPQVFKKKLINLAKYTINIHAALLPQYRGMMPSFWVLAKGENKSGVTVHYVNERVDKGKIILQKTIDVSPQETLHSLQRKVANVGATALLEAMERIQKGNGVGVRPGGGGSYYSFPTKEAAKEFRARGRRFI